MLECVESMLIQLADILPILVAIYVCFDVTALLLFRSS